MEVLFGMVISFYAIVGFLYSTKRSIIKIKYFFKNNRCLMFESILHKLKIK